MKKDLTALQLKQLTADLNPNRVATRAQGRGSNGPKLSYLEAWDVRTALIRIFGYGGFSYETTTEVLQVEPAVPRNGGGTQFRFTVMATVRLYIPQLDCYFQESAVSSQSQPDPGECADFAVKTAESDALKRCAVNLGTQFGLSLYNKGATIDVVKAVIAPDQAAIVKRLQLGEKASTIDAETAGGLERAVDVAEPADTDRQYGYDPDHGDTGLTGGAEPPAPGEDPAEDQPRPEATPAQRAAARDQVKAGFTRTKPGA